MIHTHDGNFNLMHGLYENAVHGVRDGILRWLDRPENAELKLTFTSNPSHVIYLNRLPVLLWQKMDAENWIDTLTNLSEEKFDRRIKEIWMNGEDFDLRPVIINCQPRHLWDDAMYQVTEILCPTEEE